MVNIFKKSVLSDKTLSTKDYEDILLRYLTEMVSPFIFTTVIYTWTFVYVGGRSPCGYLVSVSYHLLNKPSLPTLQCQCLHISGFNIYIGLLVDSHFSPLSVYSFSYEYCNLLL